MFKFFVSVMMLLALLATAGCGGGGSSSSSPFISGGSTTVPGDPVDPVDPGDPGTPIAIGVLVDLGDLIGDTDSWFWTETAMINNVREVVGQANNSDDGSPKEAFYWDASSETMEALGGHTGGPYSDYYYLKSQTPDDWLIYSEATEINDSGTIIGHSTTGSGWPDEGELRAFVIQADGSFFDLPPVPYYDNSGNLKIGEFSQANDINELGNVLVTLDDEEGQHAYFWDGTTLYKDIYGADPVFEVTIDNVEYNIPILDYPLYQGTCSILNQDSEGVAINELQHAVMNSGSTAVWCDIDKGIVESLNGFDGSSVGVDINNRVSLGGSGNQVSHIAGNSADIAFFWDGGAMLPLGTLADDDSGTSETVDMNDLDQITGNATTNEGTTHAFIWSNATKTMVDLGTLGGDNSYATAINDAGQVVGYSETGELYDQDGVTKLIVHGFLWDDGKMYDLGSHNDFYTFSFGEPYPFSKAVDINDSGEIVGFSYTINNHKRAFYLNPTILP